MSVKKLHPQGFIKRSLLKLAGLFRALTGNMSAMTVRLVSFAGAFACVGLALLVFAHAATGTVSLEIESGSRTGGAVVSDSSASGARAVMFGTTSGNILSGKTFTADVADSSTETGNPISNMTDGNLSTRWISQPVSPVNAQVDMGSVYTLSSVTITFAADTIKNYQVAVSTDGSSWTTVTTGVTNNTSSQTVALTSFSAPAKGRYLRITGIDRWDASYGNSIWEVAATAVGVSGGGTGGGTGTWWSGESDNTTTQNGTFAAWRGRAVEIGGSWASSQNAGDAIASPTWSIAPGTPYGNTPRMDYAIGAMIDNSGENWTAAASGAYDSRWAQQLQQLKSSWGSRQASNMYIRFAHEFNGNWYPWSVSNGDVANFKTAWARFANLRNQYFPGAQIVWCPNAGSSWNYDIRTLYPGNAYVDVIGVDKYNNYPWVNDQAGFNTEINSTSNGGPLGLETYRQFALQQGKPFAVSEWSNDGNPAGEGNQGGGDGANYVQYFHDWLTANGSQTPQAGKVLYEVLFNVTGYSSSWYSFFPLDAETGNTAAANKYAELW